MKKTNEIYVGMLQTIREEAVVLGTDGGNCEYCEGDPR